MTKKHTNKQQLQQQHHHQRSDSSVSVLVLSLASARLTLERSVSARQSKTSGCCGWCSLDRMKAATAYRLRQWKRSLAITGDRLRVALFGGELSRLVSEEKNIKSKKGNGTEMLVSPTLADSKRGGDGAQKHFHLPAFAAEEISLLRDIVKYAYESRFDVVLLQEVQDEQTFVYLLQLFKEIKLRHAHYSRMDFRGGSSSSSAFPCSPSSDVHHTGLAVFSRWPLASVAVQQFDPVLSTLQLSTFLPTMISNWCSGLAVFGGSGNGGITSEATRLANGVQYVQLQVAMNGVQRTTTVHLFNSDLLHRSFFKVVESADGQKEEEGLCPPPATDLEIWERSVLRFCQAYELAKLVEALTKTQQQQIAETSDQPLTAKNGSSELVIIGGHFGRLQGDTFGVDCTVKPAVVASSKKKKASAAAAPVTNTVYRLTVQDVLQTFIDGLQNAFERPEKVATAAVGGLALLNRSKSFRNGQLFHSLKSEQLFIKFLDSPPSSTTAVCSTATLESSSVKTKKTETKKEKATFSSKLPSKLPSSSASSQTGSTVHCRINFVQTRLRFESYASAIFREAGDGTFHEAMVTLDSLRAVNIKLARGEAVCIEPPGVLQQQQQMMMAAAVSGKGKTSTSSKKLSKKRTSPSVRNTMGQIEVKLVPPFVDGTSNVQNQAKATDQKLLVIEAFKWALERYQVHLRRALLFDCLPPYLCSLAALSLAVLLKRLPMEACTVLAVALLLLLYFSFFRRLGAFRAKMSKVQWLLAQLNLERTQLQCRLVQRNYQPFESTVWEAYFREERAAVQMSSSVVEGSGSGSNGLDLKMMSNLEGEIDVMGSESGIADNDSRILSHTSTATF